MSHVTRDQLRAADDLLEKLSAVLHYGEHEGHEVVMTAFVADVVPARPEFLKSEPDDMSLPVTTELFFVREGDEWVLAEINPVGKSFR